jgi:hypothetical protein
LLIGRGHGSGGCPGEEGLEPGRLL